MALSTSYPDIPVILMSGFGISNLAELGIVVPCGILAKPFRPEVLLQEVERCLKARR